MLLWCYALHYRTQLKCHRETLKNCFTQDSQVNEPFSPKLTFVSSISFHLHCKKFYCDEKQNVSACDQGRRRQLKSGTAILCLRTNSRGGEGGPGHNINIWQYFKAYARAQTFISVLLRMQKEDYAKVNIIALKLQT